jgi:hypothetical protein
VNRIRFRYREYFCRYLFIFCSVIIFYGLVTQASELPQGRLDKAIIITQLPVSTNQRIGTNWFRDFGNEARIIKVNPDLSLERLSRDFHSACDPSVSFDASHILFAGKRSPDDDWNIYEMEEATAGIRIIRLCFIRLFLPSPGIS